MTASSLPRLAVRLHGGCGPRRCAALAASAEQCGYAGVWLAENPFEYGAFANAAACAMATHRSRIGLGIVNPYTRHPAQIAMEFAALDELAGGRALLGIGSGIGRQIEQLGFRYRPLAALADAVHILRALLRGETVHYRGRAFCADGAALRCRPVAPDPPIYLAAMGDRSLALCGRIADGLIVSNLCPPRYTEHAVSIVAEAASAAGRSRPAVVQYVPCVARPGSDEARHAAKAGLGGMLARFWPTSDDWPPLRETIVRHSLIPRGEFVAALHRLRQGEPAATVLDDRFVDAFAIAGTAEECVAAALRYADAGADELALTFAAGQPEADMAYLAGAADLISCRHNALGD